jgi:adenylate cyclase
MTMERKLAAILCADVFGYSRLMGEDEEATLRTLSSHRKIVDGLIAQHRGRFVNSAGDSVLAEFASVVNAVQCAVEVQAALKTENAVLPLTRRMEFRIGVNLGDVMAEGEQIYGDGVNVAARLEGLAQPGGICISGIVHDQINNKLALTYDDLGKQSVKNIAKPVRVFRIALNGTASPLPAKRPIRRSYWRGGVLSIAGLAIIVATFLVVQHISFKPPQTHASIPPAVTNPSIAAVQSTELPLPDKPSIAVLPFINMTRDQEQEYFSDGITDDLITDLSRLPGLFVIARDSTFTYKDKAAKLQDVGKELGVRYVLEGSVRKADQQVRITAQLADATTGDELWAERYDRPLGDVFALQDEIVRRIVTTLKLQIDLSVQGFLFPRTTDSLEAYDDMLRGTEDWLSATREGNAKARPLLEKAIELDPKYAEAYALLGANYWTGWLVAFNPDPNGLEKAMQMERQAIALDDSLALAHSVLSDVYDLKGLNDQAVTEAQRGIALDPNSVLGYFWLANVLNRQVKPAEALVACDKAMRLDPRNPDNYVFQQGLAYTRLGRWEEAVAAFKHYMAHFPDLIWPHAFLAWDYSDLGEDGGAQTEAAEVERIAALSPASSSISYVALAIVMNVVGKPAGALAAIDKAIRLDPRNPGALSREAEGLAYTLLGRWPEAIDAFKLHLIHFPDNFWAHAYLAVDYMELGHEDAARSEVTEVLRLDPQFTVGTAFPTISLQHRAFPAEIDRFRGDLHKAGMS